MINKTPLILIAVALAVLAGLLWPGGKTTSTLPAKTATVLPIGGAFTLVDENGQNVTDQNYAATKKLLFFGFTYCPSICPTELLKMADILTALKDNARKVTPLFITIDPARDTPDVMKTYTDKFDPRIVGLTGTQDQIDATVKSFRAYAARVPQGKEYTMDHSAFMYLTDETNEMITIYKMDQTADEIAADLKTRL